MSLSERLKAKKTDKLKKIIKPYQPLKVPPDFHKAQNHRVTYSFIHSPFRMPNS